MAMLPDFKAIITEPLRYGQLSGMPPSVDNMAAVQYLV
ncbi:MAG: hypothetical protein [Olavius algarvensis Delta 4 endosymbiont]|nr:MAG: hypothetical protein [Olavius algarvensis Delta 4 endosymbiont]